MGNRGHGYSGDVEVHVDKRHRGRIDRSLWRWMKRRAAMIEPGIGHLKREHRMERNRLSGVEGDRFNAILSAVGMNLHKLLRGAVFFRQIFSLASILSKNNCNGRPPSTVIGTFERCFGFKWLKPLTPTPDCGRQS